MRLTAFGGVSALVFAAPIFAQSADPVDRGAPPEAIKPGYWVKEEDLRGATERGGVPSAVRIALTIDASGRVFRCDVVRSSGNTALDQYTCDLLMKRAAFKPAKDQVGIDIASKWSRVISWGQSINADPSALYDAIIRVNKLPSGKRFVKLSIRETIAADGARESCKVKPSGDDPALEREACALIAQSAPASPLKAADGTLLRGVRTRQVLFLADVK